MGPRTLLELGEGQRSTHFTWACLSLVHELSLPFSKLVKETVVMGHANWNNVKQAVEA